MADEERILKIRLQYVSEGGASAQAAKTGADSVTRALKATEEQAARTTAQLRQLRAAGREMRQIGLEVGLVGAAIGGPLLAAAKAFVDANQKTSYIARQWQGDTDKITASYQRIGGVVARELLPSLDKAAGLVDKLADFADRNPQIIKAALGTSGVLVGTGAALVAAGQLTQSIANLGLLMTALNKAAAGTGAGAAVAGGASTALTLGGAAVVGTAIGYAAGAVIASAVKSVLPPVDQQQYSALLRAQQMGGGSLLGVGSTEGLNIAANTQALNANTQALTGSAFFNAADRSARQTEGLAGPGFYATAKAAALPAFQAYQEQKSASTDNYVQTRIRILDDFQKTYWDNEAHYAQSRSRQVRDFEQQEKDALANFTTNRARQLRDFAQNEQRDEQAYYENRLKLARDYNTETARAEQDHQDELRKLQDDHQQRSRDLAAAGDALGFVKEQRDYEKQRAESEKQYQKDTARRNQDYATQLKDGEEAFKEQRAQRLKDFEQQQKDQADDFKKEQDLRAQQQAQRLRDQDSDFQESQRKLREQKDQRLRDLDANYLEEQAHIKKAFTDTLNAIDPILTGMQKDVTKAFEATETAFAKYLDGLTSISGGGSGVCQPGYHWDNQLKACMPNSYTGRAAGGYAGYGMTMLGERGIEYVLDHPTTSAAERLVGGRLDQEKILAALSRSNSYAVNLGGINVSGGGRNEILGQLLPMVDSRIEWAFDQFGQELA